MSSPFLVDFIWDESPRERTCGLTYILVSLRVTASDKWVGTVRSLYMVCVVWATCLSDERGVDSAGNRPGLQVTYWSYLSIDGCWNLWLSFKMAPLSKDKLCCTIAWNTRGNTGNLLEWLSPNCEKGEWWKGGYETKLQDQSNTKDRWPTHSSARRICLRFFSPMLTTSQYSMIN